MNSATVFSEAARQNEAAPAKIIRVRLAFLIVSAFAALLLASSPVRATGGVGNRPRRQKADRLHHAPFPARLPSAAVRQTGQINVEDFEVTQSVQNRNHDVPLIAGKVTAVRAYLSYGGEGCVNVRGVLTARLPSGEILEVNSENASEVNRALNGDIQRKRGDEKLSLNFRLPETAITIGSLPLEVKLKSVTHVASASGTCSGATGVLPIELICANCEEKSRIIPNTKIVESPTLKLRLVALSYQSGTPPVNHVPSDEDLALTKSWLVRAYPVAKSRLIFVQDNSQPRPISKLTRPFNWKRTCRQANAELAALRGEEENARLSDRTTRYYGLVAESDEMMDGCSDIIPKAQGFPLVNASGSAGRPPGRKNEYGWDPDSSYGDFTAGHEIAHTLGRKHPGFCLGNDPGSPDGRDTSFPPHTRGHLSGTDGDYVGFDVGDPELKPSSLPMRALRGQEWTDIMTYCSNRWVSSHTYNAILTWLKEENEIAAKLFGVAPAPTPAPAPPSFLGLPVNVAGVASVRLGTGTEKGVQSQKIQEEGNVIHVVATLDLSNVRGDIISVNRFFEASGATATKARNERQAKVILKDDADKVLEWYFVSVKETTDEPPPPGEPADDSQGGIVDALVPFHPGTTKVELALFRKSGEAEEEVTVATYHIGKSAPRVRNVRLPNSALFIAKLKERASGAQPLPSGDAIPLKITWETSKSDSDTTTYKVEISSDANAEWRPLAVGLSETYFDLKPEILNGIKSFKIRITATDGLNNSTATSGTILLRAR